VDHLWDTNIQKNINAAARALNIPQSRIIKDFSQNGYQKFWLI
jgi:hypothetical protein